MVSITNCLTSILLIFLTLFSHLAHYANSSSDSGCVESEREALLEFKAGLVSGSSSLPSWNGSDCCSWHGITCHNVTGHVQRLQLGGYPDQYYFNSSMSPWLFNLTHLEVLNISRSGLRGPIPNMFEKLTSLVHLDLSNNRFDSEIFPDSLCSLTTLVVLRFTFNDFLGPLPFCIGNLTSLTTLSLDWNRLSGEIPSGLGNLTQLITLDLSNNHFNSSIPSTLGNLRNLESLDLRSNRLSGTIPSTLGNLPKLKDFHVSENSLSGELSEFFFEGLKSLEQLALFGNHRLVLSVSPQWIPPFQLSTILMNDIFIGTQIPPWLRTQTNLQVLTMGYANISGAIPDWFLTDFPNLTDVGLSNNFLTGSIPNQCLADIPKLKSLDLSNNLLTGSIPELCLTVFPSLTLIDLSNNLLTGSAPAFQSAKFLNLYGNQFSGNIPQNICNLPSLQNLDLSYNKLVGRIPSCLGDLHSLIVLNMEYNILSGSIPNQIGSLRNLRILHLNGNKFSGELPESLQNLAQLATLDLGENELQGSIPQWIGKSWPSLQYLRLESNNISGEIPLSLCQLSSLQMLNLALNNLFGTIPPCFGNLSKMLSDDSGNGFLAISYSESLLNYNKGREMTYTSSLPYTKFITLSGNHLHGEVPIELMNLEGLQSMNLSNNELTGTIPDAINKLKNLESLDLSMNRLSGIIPQTLAEIDDLSFLNLSFNNLVGRIPSGNHFDTLNDPSIYEGNLGLCGKLLVMTCPGDGSPNGPVTLANADAGQEFEFLWLYAGIGPGFAVGFLAVICSLFFKDAWRIAYFGFVDGVYDKLRVTFAIKVSQLSRKLN